MADQPSGHNFSCYLSRQPDRFCWKPQNIFWIFALPCGCLLRHEGVVAAGNLAWRLRYSNSQRGIVLWGLDLLLVLPLRVIPVALKPIVFYYLICAVSINVWYEANCESPRSTMESIVSCCVLSTKVRFLAHILGQWEINKRTDDSSQHTVYVCSMCVCYEK